MTTKPKPDLRFSIRVVDDKFMGDSTRYLQVEARVVILEERGGRAEWTSPRPYSEIGGGEYEQLVVAAQMTSDNTGDFYGREVRFTHSRVGQVEAESMVKVFRKIQRKLDEFDRQFGYPSDFAAYLARIAAAIGMSGSCFGRRSDMGWDGYAWMDAKELGYHLSEQLRDWRAKYGYNKEAAA